MIWGTPLRRISTCVVALGVMVPMFISDYNDIVNDREAFRRGAWVFGLPLFAIILIYFIATAIGDLRAGTNRPPETRTYTGRYMPQLGSLAILLLYALVVFALVMVTS